MRGVWGGRRKLLPRRKCRTFLSTLVSFGQLTTYLWARVRTTSPHRTVLCCTVEGGKERLGGSVSTGGSTRKGGWLFRLLSPSLNVQSLLTRSISLARLVCSLSTSRACLVKRLCPSDADGSDNYPRQQQQARLGTRQRLREQARVFRVLLCLRLSCSPMTNMRLPSCVGHVVSSFVKTATLATRGGLAAAKRHNSNPNLGAARPRGPDSARCRGATTRLNATCQ